LGDEGAELLMAQFDDIVTKGFVTEQISGVRAEVAEVRLEVAGLRGEMREGFATLRDEMHQGFGTLRAEWKEDLNTIVGGAIRWTISTALTLIALSATILGMVALLKG
jgi:hypothetical protein